MADPPVPLNSLGVRVRLGVFLRSFLVQGSWNYRSLIGPGFAYALLPALRRLYRDRPEDFRSAVVRHEELFNCHPYLSGLALGAVARMEEEGDSPQVISRFKIAIRGSLGTLGDRLIWAGWRPVCALATLTLLLLGAPWWIAVGFFLVAYNAGHLALRVWGFRLGYRYGKAVAERLRRAPLRETQHFLATTGALLVGAATPLVLTGSLTEYTLSPPWVVGAAVAAVLGLRVGSMVRNSAGLALAGLAVLGLIAGVAL